MAFQALGPIPLVFVLIEESLQEDIISLLWQGSKNSLDAKTLKESDLRAVSADGFLFGDQKKLLAITNASNLKKEVLSSLFSGFDEGLYLKPLLLSSPQLLLTSPLRKEIEKRGGKIIDLSTDRGWIPFLIELVQGEGLTLTPQVAHHLMRLFERDKILLFSDLKKLIAYVGEKKEIAIADIDAMMSSHGELKSLFQLGDAICQGNLQNAYHIAKSHLNEGLSLFALIAHLKTQMRNASIQLLLLERDGKEAVLARFPYIAGFFDKKISQLKVFGKQRFKRALYLLTEAEVQAKSIEIDPLLSLELLLTKMISNDPYHSAQSPRRP